ncbi:unknown [Bacteroides sp. CAG:770]|nr:unknown [Bacteroides sp. CAG:770]
MLHTYILTMEDTFIVDIIIVAIPGEVEAFKCRKSLVICGI